MGVWLEIRWAAATELFSYQLLHTGFVYLFSSAEVYHFVFTLIELTLPFFRSLFCDDFDLADSILRGKVQANADNSANQKHQESSFPYPLFCVISGKVPSSYSGKVPTTHQALVTTLPELIEISEEQTSLKPFQFPLPHDPRSISTDHSVQWPCWQTIDKPNFPGKSTDYLNPLFLLYVTTACLEQLS